MEVKFDQANLEAAIIKQAVDTLYDDDRLYEQVKAEINKRVDAALAAGLHKAIESAINGVVEKALDTEMHPINIWGDREANPTTIRAALHERAKNFWSEKVDNKGEKTTYGGVPRYEHVLSIITAKEFDTQIKQNIVNIAGAIKDSVRDGFYKQVDEKLNEFFKIKSAGDQKKPAHPQPQGNNNG